MKQTTIQCGEYSLNCHVMNTVVVGTGAAGYNAAARLYQYGQRDIAIVTEGINTGTSRNTGSDKQTYYKLTLAGEGGDSVREMASTFFAGQCMDGDNALCEAALSAQSFLRLVELGVPFPRNRYGEFVGYKTDHDPRQRATSVGPYTSRFMTEKLQESIEAAGIKVFDKMQVIRVLTDEDTFRGLLCLDLSNNSYKVFIAKNVVYATGGPAGIYSDSVFPIGHYGATGIAFEAGVTGKNLTEWQYGLASVKPRWNVSGTYMQVLPCFISTAQDGSDEREFLQDYLEDEGDMLDKVFLKGYEWPFDVRKVDNGSSIIDILVYMETLKGRRVFLEFRRNPFNKDIDYSKLSGEQHEYLKSAGACFGTPLERLLHMNAPAVSFYRDKGVDLASEPLEIALCAQHNNGGLDIDCWWQTNIKGFFAVGEAAAAHGVYRPGGSALNSGQVGSTRAAQYIAAKCKGEASEVLSGCVINQIEETIKLGDMLKTFDTSNVLEIWNTAAKNMSFFGGPIRDNEGIIKILSEVKSLKASFIDTVKIASPEELKDAYRLWDVLICQQVYLEAMADYVSNGGKSRGSALYTDKSGSKPYEFLPDTFTFLLDDSSRADEVQQVTYTDGVCKFNRRKVRPIPKDDDFFENVWRGYRENQNIDD